MMEYVDEQIGSAVDPSPDISSSRELAEALRCPTLPECAGEVTPGQNAREELKAALRIRQGAEAEWRAAVQTREAAPVQPRQHMSGRLIGGARRGVAEASKPKVERDSPRSPKFSKDAEDTPRTPRPNLDDVAFGSSSPRTTRSLPAEDNPRGLGPEVPPSTSASAVCNYANKELTAAVQVPRVYREWASKTTPRRRGSNQPNQSMMQGLATEWSKLQDVNATDSLNHMAFAHSLRSDGINVSTFVDDIAPQVTGGYKRPVTDPPGKTTADPLPDPERPQGVKDVWDAPPAPRAPTDPRSAPLPDPLPHFTTPLERPQGAKKAQDAPPASSYHRCRSAPHLVQQAYQCDANGGRDFHGHVGFAQSLRSAGFGDTSYVEANKYGKKANNSSPRNAHERWPAQSRPTSQPKKPAQQSENTHIPLQSEKRATRAWQEGLGNKAASPTRAKSKRKARRGVQHGFSANTVQAAEAAGGARAKSKPKANGETKERTSNKAKATFCMDFSDMRKGEAKRVPLAALVTGW